MDKKELIDCLNKSLKEGEKPLARVHALDLFYEKFPSEAFPVIINSLHFDKSAKVRAKAVKLLGRYKSPEAVEILLKVRENNDDQKVLAALYSVLKNERIQKIIKNVRKNK